MYDLIVVLMGEAYVLETGVTLDDCNAIVSYLYDNFTINTAARFSCETVV